MSKVKSLDEILKEMEDKPGNIMYWLKHRRKEDGKEKR